MELITYTIIIHLAVIAESAVPEGLQLKKTVIMIVVLLFMPYSLSADEGTKILTLGYIEFAPYTFTNEAGNPEGILIDLAGKVFPEAGYEWGAVSYPVKRLVEYLISGDLDIWMGLKTLPDFIGNTYIWDEIVASLFLNAYTMGDNLPVIKKEDLAGKSVIILRGYSYGGWIHYIKDKKNNVAYVKANKHLSALKMLQAKRADYLLDYREPIDRALKNISMSELKHNQISSLPCYFIVSKKVKDGVDIINRLEKVFLQKKKDGLL